MTDSKIENKYVVNLQVAFWNDISNGIDNTEINWSFSFGDAEYTLVSIPNVIQDLLDYKQYLIDFSLKQNINNIVYIINTLPEKTLIAFDG